MKWASAISQNPDAVDALEDCVRTVREHLGSGQEAHLALLFASPHHQEAWERIAADVTQRLPGATVVGCSGAGVIGAGQEVEAAPALSLTTGHLPGVNITAFHLAPDEVPSPDAPPDAWWTKVGVQPEASPQFMLLVDSFSTPPEALLAGLDFAYPASVKIGGLANGGHMGGGNALFLNERAYRGGAVGVALSGNVIVDTVVAQGCRPVGDPMRITHADGNLLLSVDEEPPLFVLQRLYERLAPEDQSLLRGDLFLGIAMDPLQDQAHPGEFLVRNLLGGDPKEGVLAVGALLHEGQVVQFHVRDAQTSREDLDRYLKHYAAEERGQASEGVVLFSCVGRGQGLYGQPNHDSDLFRDVVGGLPLGGFFCDGEIGPVGDTTYLHGYTSSFAIFRPASAPD